MVRDEAAWPAVVMLSSALNRRLVLGADRRERPSRRLVSSSSFRLYSYTVCSTRCHEAVKQPSGGGKREAKSWARVRRKKEQHKSKRSVRLRNTCKNTFLTLSAVSARKFTDDPQTLCGREPGAGAWETPGMRNLGIWGPSWPGRNVTKGN